MTKDQINKLRVEFAKPDHGEALTMLQEPINACMHYLSTLAGDFTGSKVDPRDVLNAIAWAIDFKLDNNLTDDIDAPEAISFLAVEFLATIYRYRRLSVAELHNKCLAGDDIIAEYVKAVPPEVPQKAVRESLPQNNKPKTLSLF
jgi:hypothetical protein